MFVFIGLLRLMGLVIVVVGFLQSPGVELLDLGSSRLRG